MVMGIGPSHPIPVMMRTLASHLLIILFALPGSAQEKAENSKEDPNIRPAGEIVMSFERKIEIPEVKRLGDDGVLELFPGDTVHLEFAEEEGNLVRPRIVGKVQHPKRTITLEMKQDEKMTMLSRSTEIQNTVAMDCVHRGLGSDEFFPTNLQPTEKGLAVFDSWPNSVWILRLSNIEATSRPASEVYEEKVSRSRLGKENNGEKDGADQPATAPKSE